MITISVFGYGFSPMAAYYIASSYLVFSFVE